MYRTAWFTNRLFQELQPEVDAWLEEQGESIRVVSGSFSAHQGHYVYVVLYEDLGEDDDGEVADDDPRSSW